MSLVHVVHVPDGIVLSSDSRTVMMQTPGKGTPAPSDPLEGACVFTDLANKVHLVWGTLGVAHTGDGHVGPVPVETRLRELERKPIAPTSIEDIGEAVLEVLRPEGYRPDLTVCIAGYTTSGPILFRIEVRGVYVNHIVVGGRDRPPFPYGASSFGGRSSVEGRIVESLEAACRPDFERMSISNASEYSRHVMRTVINQTRFGAGIAVVGGETDTLVLTRGGARFVSKKVA